MGGADDGGRPNESLQMMEEGQTDLIYWKSIML